MERSVKVSKWASMIVMVVLVLYVVVVSSAVTIDEKGKESNNHQKPNAVESAIGLTDHASVWTRIKSWIRIAGINFGSLIQKTEKPDAGPGEVVKDAATRSFAKSKETAEKSAKVAGDAVHKTVEKVKRTVSRAGETMKQDL